ncbi:hypothetical protein CLHUN_39730 [Ruminiclostridium hungatei]|uniref:Uncharacterized protein n=1 Tax=Ruminiclostridium hungatei TaxID=48256 RepID=A0A1V4SF98_RUMHU|nr:hypothetical protein [Ruminiclostridium hungatei]OPX42186.1 hypothetical protein CLHUN_39730 [Ruminiclostridium hungatei]
MIRINIEAVLLDSGRVLNAPKTGHWFIPSQFFSYVDKSKYESISFEKRNLAFSRAGEYLNSLLMQSM